MSLGEGVSCRVTYKAYSTGVIQSNSQPVSAADPMRPAAKSCAAPRATCP